MYQGGTASDPYDEASELVCLGESHRPEAPVGRPLGQTAPAQKLSLAQKKVFNRKIILMDSQDGKY